MLLTFLGSSIHNTSGKEPAYQSRRHRDSGTIPRLERSPGGGNANPLQYSCLENSMGRGAWWLQPIPWSHKEFNMTEAIEHTLLGDVLDILLAPPDRLSRFFYSVLYPENIYTFVNSCFIKLSFISLLNVP